MSNIKPILRPTQDTDHDFLLELYKTTHGALIYEQMPELLSEQLLHSQFTMKEQSYAQMYPNGDNNIIEINQSSVGRLFVNTAADEIRLVDIIICPSARGQGVGSFLLKQILSKAEAKKLPVHLQVAIDNIKARQLYKKQGFIEEHNDGVNIHSEYLEQGKS